MKKDLNSLLPELRLKIDQADLWGQLAEECAELAQAALKMERLLRGTNPPAKSLTECRASVLEEVADVYLVLEVLHWPRTNLLGMSMIYKAERWLSRLGASKNDGLNSSASFIDDSVSLTGDDRK